MVQAKRIFMLMIKVIKLFSFFIAEFSKRNTKYLKNYMYAYHIGRAWYIAHNYHDGNPPPGKKILELHYPVMQLSCPLKLACHLCFCFFLHIKFTL